MGLGLFSGGVACPFCQLWQDEGGQQSEYRMTIKSRNSCNAERLASHLRGLPEVVEFRITPTCD